MKFKISKENTMVSLVIVLTCVLCSVVVIECEETQAPTAQKRFGFDWKEWKKEKKEKNEGHGESPGVLPGGFGTYPLWKFHKFDGFSLRPVPMQLDIGYGLPSPPPTYMPNNAYVPPQGYGGGQQSYNQPPPSYSQGNYYSPPQSYPQQSNSYGPPPQSVGYAAPISIQYQPVQPSNYAPSQPAYGQPQQTYSQPPQAPPQTYSQPPQAPQQTYSQPSQQGYGASDMSYGLSSPVPVEASPAGGYGKAPYTSFDNSNSYGGMSEYSMQMDPNAGGYMKRHYNVNPEEDKEQKPNIPEPDSNSQNKKQQ